MQHTVSIKRYEGAPHSGAMRLGVLPMAIARKFLISFNEAIGFPPRKEAFYLLLKNSGA